MFGFLFFGYVVASVAFYILSVSRAVRIDEPASGDVVILFPESVSKAA